MAKKTWEQWAAEVSEVLGLATPEPTFVRTADEAAQAFRNGHTNIQVVTPEPMPRPGLGDEAES